MGIVRETRSFRGNLPSRGHSRYYSESEEIVGGGRGLLYWRYGIWKWNWGFVVGIHVVVLCFSMNARFQNIFILRH